MSARDDILQRVRAARVATFGAPRSAALPDLSSFLSLGHEASGVEHERAGVPTTRAGAESTAPVVHRFVESARAAAFMVRESSRAMLARELEDLVANAVPAGDPARGDRGDASAASRNEPRRVLSIVPDVPGNVALPAAPHAMADLSLLLCEGVLGVAENGAIWLPASRLGERAALVLAQHVAVVLSRSAIVRTMHDAYARLDVGAESFGLFLAGPSKTADIEQSLVIGAHGATGATVLLVE